MKKAVWIVAAVYIGLFLFAAGILAQSFAAESQLSPTEIHKFKKSKSRMESRKKKKSRFSKRKHFGETKKKGSTEKTEDKK